MKGTDLYIDLRQAGKGRARELPSARRGKTKARPSAGLFTLMSLREGKAQPFLMAICFSFFCASGVFGRLTVNTPSLKVASILSLSMPSGTVKERWNEP